MRKRIESVRHAMRGLREVFVHERNFQIQTIVALGVAILMFVFPLSLLERVILVLVIALVLLLEVTNSALEYTLDIFRPERNPKVGRVKDVMAGAVLLGALGAVMIGALIFLPYIFSWML